MSFLRKEDKVQDPSKKVETKVEEERIDIPEGLLIAIKELAASNDGLMNQFVYLSENRAQIEKAVRDNCDKRENGKNRFFKLLQHTLHKMKLDPKLPWHYDLHKGQFYRVIKPKGLEISKEKPVEVIAPQEAKQ